MRDLIAGSFSHPLLPGSNLDLVLYSINFCQNSIIPVCIPSKLFPHITSKYSFFQSLVRKSFWFLNLIGMIPTV